MQSLGDERYHPAELILFVLCTTALSIAALFILVTPHGESLLVEYMLGGSVTYFTPAVLLVLSLPVAVTAVFVTTLLARLVRKKDTLLIGLYYIVALPIVVYAAGIWVWNAHLVAAALNTLMVRHRPSEVATLLLGSIFILFFSYFFSASFFWRSDGVRKKLIVTLRWLLPVLSCIVALGLLQQYLMGA